MVILIFEIYSLNFSTFFSILMYYLHKYLCWGCIESMDYIVFPAEMHLLLCSQIKFSINGFSDEVYGWISSGFDDEMLKDPSKSSCSPGEVLLYSLLITIIKTCSLFIIHHKPLQAHSHRREAWGNVCVCVCVLWNTTLICLLP